ncbi:MAG: FadR/GntR family transcriptional regulator [Anaerolineae bacterium]|nr:FadR/GntR family transcriptional regulator [Anaerolineae bacterium]
MSGSSLFPTIGAEGRLVDRVVDEIQKLIVSGRLEPGARLPPERELAGQLGVSRTVMREAVHILVARGLLESKPGVGTMVRQVTSGQVAEPLLLLLQTQGHRVTVDDLHQVRSILEVAIADLAAANATPDDIDHLRRVMEGMEAARGDPAGFAQRDAEYHRALAQATHNPLLVALLDSIRDLMREVRQLVATQPGLAEMVLPYHRRLLERVIAGDARGARREMREHLEQARSVQEAALRQQEAQSAMRQIGGAT